MKKVTYEMELLSSLIVSPRSGQAFYYGIDFEQKPVLDMDADGSKGNNVREVKVKVVYPFYQYGEYTKYDPRNAEYYLPGSSVKGAFLQKQEKSSNNQEIAFMADDVPVDRTNIVLRNLVKAQYIEQKGEAAFSPFFENVGIEMVRAGTVLHGEMYLEEKKDFAELLENANRKSKKKMNQMCEYLQSLLNTDNAEFAKEVNEIEKQLYSLSKEENIILMGGYKGLLHAIILSKGEKREEIKSGIYIDREKNLPHGLVRIKHIKNNEIENQIDQYTVSL